MYKKRRRNNMAFISKNISEPYFSDIKSGKKIVEGRLNKKEWKNVRVYDIIRWYNDSNDIFDTRVIDVYYYDTFENMLDIEGLEVVLPGCPSIDEGVNIYRSFYSKEDEDRYGVVGIKLMKLD